MSKADQRRPFAVFDIDGTLIRWQLYHAIVDELGRTGNIPEESYRLIKEARKIWKHRASTTSFGDYERTLVEAYETAIVSVTYQDYMKAVEAVFHEYRQQTYKYTRGLIESLKKKGYLIFALSGSQQEAIALLADHYGFDDFKGSVYERDGERFTGEKDIIRRDRKPEMLKELVAAHNARWEDSIAVGDSEGDIPMLSAVENPVAFNPNKELYEHARKHGWKIVLERKNMVYELEQRNGEYVVKN